MRILIGTVEISGIATDLCSSLQQAGEDVQLLLRQPHRFGYAVQHSAWLVRIWHKLHDTSGMGLLRRSMARLGSAFWSLVVLGWAIRRFDTFLYLFGVGVTNSPLEFRLLRLLGKRVIVFYVGSDERPPFMNGAVCHGEREPTLAQLKALTAAKKRRILACEKYASVCIGSPFSGQFHERPFVNCFSLGIPRQFKIPSSSKKVPQRNGRVRILHAPSQSAAKGSKVIEQMIHNLSEKGLPIDYVRLENASNAQVLLELSKSDFVVDQLYADTPMAAFATEAAYLGKPAVVAGYLGEHLYSCLRREDIPPSLYVRPEELQSAIERLVVDECYRQELGRKIRQFVQCRWSPEEVARRYQLLLRNEVPKEWWFDPFQIEYPNGYGLAERKLGQIVGQMVQRYGHKSLCLDDKPAVQAQLLAIALRVKDRLNA